ncbi:M56 family metallopeptidase [Pseudonocardia alni]|uniref:M56 family metallopeptidase n=1 Tax=Pseudonocardia alni TaxID=33907 RepID=UPI00368AFD6C
MTVALGLLLAAVALGVTGPAYLRPTADPRVHPGLALSAWVVTLLAAAGSAVTAAAVLVLPDPSVPDGMLGVAVVCWRALARGTEIPWLLLVRLLVGVTLLALLARVAGLFAASLRRQRRHRTERCGALRAVAEVRDGVWWIPCDDPVAFSLGGGRRGIVVAATGLRRLGPRVVDAVLAHERAHVRGRHHLAVALAVAAADALPRVPLCRAAPGAVGVLCELAADAAAVRRHGPAAVRAALAGTAGRTVTPRGAVGFDAFPEVRRSWLDSPRSALLRGDGAAARLLTGAVALVPALLPAAGAVALMLAACLAP